MKMTAEKTGRIVYQQSGVGANVILIPNGAEAGSGSQLSLAAMQALGIPLTELARLKVYAQ